ncbi:hypothetical protein P7C70_g7166, partial [Phenoliferia sp. Uapishka_3]
MSQPLSQALNLDLSSFIGDMLDDLRVAIRSALAVGQPATLVESHLLCLQLEYEPGPVDLRRRFSLLFAEVIPLVRARSMWDWWASRQPDPPSCHNPKVYDLGFDTALHICAYRKGEFTPNMAAAPADTEVLHCNKVTAEPALFQIPLSISYEYYSEVTPYDQRMINSDWVAHLKMSLRRPRKGVVFLKCEDLTNSETPASFRRIQMQMKAEDLLEGISSHVLFLLLDYDAVPTKLRERFSLVEAEVIPFHEAQWRWERSAGGNVKHPSCRIPQKDENGFKTTLFFYATRKGDFKRKVTAEGKVAEEELNKLTARPAFSVVPVACSYASYSELLPHDQRAINTNWAGALKESLRRDRQDVAHLKLEDLKNCETEEKMRQIKLNAKLFWEGKVWTLDEMMR